MPNLLSLPLSTYRVMLHISDRTVKKEKKERDDHSVQLGTAQGEVALKESTGGESDETVIKVEDDSDQEGHGNDSDWVVEVGIEFIGSDEDGDDHDDDGDSDYDDEDDDDDGCPSEEGRSMKEKKGQHGHQVTDGFGRAKLASLSESLQNLQQKMQQKMQRQNHVVIEVPFKRFDVGEVARAEGVSGTSVNKIR